MREENLLVGVLPRLLPVLCDSEIEEGGKNILSVQCRIKEKFRLDGILSTLTTKADRVM